MSSRYLPYLFFTLVVVFSMTACRSGTQEQNNTSATIPGSHSDSLLHSEELKPLTDSINRFPGNSSLYFERGNKLFTLKEYELAGKDIQKAIALDPLRVDYVIALGEIGLSENKFASASEAFRRVLQLDPRNLMARLQLSFSLYQQMDYQNAIRESDTVISRYPQISQAYGIQARAYEALKDSAKAIELMRKAVTLSPKDYNALMAMGDLLLSHHDEEALGYYERAKVADTTQGEPLFCIGLIYTQKKQQENAISAYRECIGRDAFYLDAYLNLGKLYESKNDWQNAWKTFNLATRISPTSSEAFFQRGFCFEKMKNIKAAINDYENALDLKSTNAEAKAALDRLKKENTSTNS